MIKELGGGGFVLGPEALLALRGKLGEEALANDLDTGDSGVEKGPGGGE